ncbi:hypothetical protein FOXYSP1_13105 [Fusarium oxysporum f. sp. phaseoli]
MQPKATSIGLVIWISTRITCIRHIATRLSYAHSYQAGPVGI